MLIESYDIKQGDNMSSIAKSAGISLSALISANPQVKNPNLIYPSNTLNIPTVVSTTLKKTSGITPVAVIPKVTAPAKTAAEIQASYITAVNSNISSLPGTKSVIENSSSLITQFTPAPIYNPSPSVISALPKAFQDLYNAFDSIKATSSIIPGKTADVISPVVGSPVDNSKNVLPFTTPLSDTDKSKAILPYIISQDAVQSQAPQPYFLNYVTPVDTSSQQALPIQTGATVTPQGYFPPQNGLIENALSGNTGISKDNMVAYASMFGLFMLLLTALGGRK